MSRETQQRGDHPFRPGEAQKEMLEATLGECETETVVRSVGGEREAIYDKQRTTSAPDRHAGRSAVYRNFSARRNLFWPSTEFAFRLDPVPQEQHGALEPV
jgi:hypothetical protein